MNQPADTQLEDAIRASLHERASAFRPVPPGLDRESDAPSPRPRNRRLVVPAAAVVTLVVTLGFGVWIVARPMSSSDVTTRDVQLPGPTDAGPEIVLEDAPTPPGVERRLTEGGAQPGGEPIRFGPGLALVTLRPDHGPPLVIATEVVGTSIRQCVGVPIMRNGTMGGWRSQQCGDGPPPPPEAPPNPDPIRDIHADGEDDVVYLTWLEVPDGTAYSTIESQHQRAWQRPRHGINVFPVSGVGPIEATVRAFAADGRLLAEVPVAKPDDGPIVSRALPTWYDLDAKLRWCDTASLAEVNLLGGGGGSIAAFDHGTGGVAQMDAREACKQAAALTPFPMGETTATYTVVNGAVHADYYEKAVSVVNGMETHTQGAPVPESVARQQIADDRARVTEECTGKRKRSARLPQCSVPF